MMGPLTAAYAGSFDPPTVGHLSLIERAACLFDQIIVAVGDNPRKRYMFSVDERKEMLVSALREHTNITVHAFDNLLVDFCREHDARVIVRGLRAVADFEFEFQMGLANRDLEPEIETLFLLADPKTLFVSSSIVKEIATGGRDVSRYVTPDVARALRERLGGLNSPRRR